MIIGAYNKILEDEIAKSKHQLYYLIDDRKFNSMDAAKICLNDENSDGILVLGSSELGGFNTEIVNQGNSNFNMYLIGRGYTQCLQSTLSLGAIENETHISKVVLILSPQWFEGSDSMNSEIFASRFQKDSFYYFMKNHKISHDTKQGIIDELKVLEQSDEMELKKIYQYENAYLKCNLIDRIQIEVASIINDTKTKKHLLEIFNKQQYTKVATPMVKFEENNIQQLLKEAEEQGRSQCTNNEFGVYDEYYDTYMKDGLESSKNSGINRDFQNENEYQYLELFLQVCNQLEIHPLIVNIPVNGRWYDYLGMPKENRENYYKRVRDIVQKYDAELADFSNCEYEKYFLKDIMHIGWKGWIKVDEEIYKYYCK